MYKPGPPLSALTRRIAETPADFLGEPRIGGQGSVHVDAVLNDVLTPLGCGGNREIMAAYGSKVGRNDRNRLKLALIASWLLADEWFLAADTNANELADLLLAALPELAASVRADAYVTEADRREELARTAIARLGFRPEGETEEQARDRLSMISAAERERLLSASRAAEARAREIREALARQAAHESADKWTRE